MPRTLKPVAKITNEIAAPPKAIKLYLPNLINIDRADSCREDLGEVKAARKV